MTKIGVLSPYGFQFETDLGNWVKCDKKLYNSVKFKSLKIMDDIISLKYNDKGFLNDFTVLSSRRNIDDGVIKSSPNDKLSDSPSSLKIVRGSSLERGEVKGFDISSPKSSSVQDSIRYAQCVNIAFQGTNFNDMNNCWYDDRITEAFDLADKIFKEFNKRCSR